MERWNLTLSSFYFSTSAAADLVWGSFNSTWDDVKFPFWPLEFLYFNFKFSLFD